MNDLHISVWAFVVNNISFEMLNDNNVEMRDVVDSKETCK